MKPSWDIFCSVVDNYGDIGVTWRLARQLVAEHDQQVRLWVDDLQAFVRLCPQAQNQAQQWQSGVQVCQWGRPWLDVPPADVVIEAFACQLPDAYVQQMRAQAQAPIWLNLEYLSAEDWVQGCHLLPSLQADGQRKVFYFPGFVEGTGGLLRERDLLERAQAFATDCEAQDTFLAGLGVQRKKDERLFSLFCYEQPNLSSWLDVLAGGAVATLLLVPEGRVRADVEIFLGELLGLNRVFRRGQLRIQLLPFIEQSAYDQLLWACDFNVVRGEDSLVRGLWALKPMLWDIYKQQGDVHLEKLEAFFELYRQSFGSETAQALKDFYWAWNQCHDLAEPWRRLEAHWPQWCVFAAMQARSMAQLPDLASGLVQFCLD